ncbi:MAG: N-acetylmuramoyl-L-alanine amidase [Planctomycetes bacterium]|nr:N-acetylmuramoyl-L-alanine amidase [Planctomycetota bacterium]
MRRPTLLLAFLLAGCVAAPTPLDEAMSWLDRRDPFEDHARPLSIPRHPAEKYLAGKVIVLDPGHGGKADVPGYKRGPTGVREAEVNLRVAHLLRRLLEDAGAHVALTRESEVSDAADDRLPDTHRRRAEIANSYPRPDGGTGADLFISLHHNAASKPEANYPSVWFHGEADWSEPALDAALPVGHRLGAELRCSGVGRTGILMSDQQMYASGFAVLRHARVPAFLVEASFFSNPDEEQRLRDAAYNLREAYAIYLGLVEWAYGGRPTQSIPAVTLADGTLTITAKLDDGLPGWWGADRQRTLDSTIAVYVDGRRVFATFDPATKVVTADAPWRSDASPDRSLELRVHHANLYKHHNWPQRYAVRLAADGTATVTPMAGRHAGEDRAGS